MRFANPERIVGTAPESVFCALATSEMPAAEAIFAINSGVKNSVSNGVMLPYIATSLLKLVARRRSGGVAGPFKWSATIGAANAKARATPCAQIERLGEITSIMYSELVDC